MKTKQLGKKKQVEAIAEAQEIALYSNRLKCVTKEGSGV